MQQEEWCLINNSKDYEISNLGNFRRFKNNMYKELARTLNPHGYYNCHYYTINNERISTRIHCLVAKCFIGERPEGLVIDHIDRNRINNNVNNLRYCTHQDNMRNSERFRIDILEEGNERKNKLNTEIKNNKRKDDDYRLYWNKKNLGYYHEMMKDPERKREYLDKLNERAREKRKNDEEHRVKINNKNLERLTKRYHEDEEYRKRCIEKACRRQREERALKSIKCLFK